MFRPVYHTLYQSIFSIILSLFVSNCMVKKVDISWRLNEVYSGHVWPTFYAISASAQHTWGVIGSEEAMMFNLA